VLAAGLAALALLALGVAVAFGGFASFTKPREYPVGHDPAGIAAGDFNRDGRLDLAVTNFQNPLSVTILKGRTRGRLKPVHTYPVPIEPDDIVVTHVNAGKDLDLVVGGLTNGIATLKGKSGAAFAAPQLIPDSNSPREVATGDFNRDGRTDIAANRQDTNDVAVYLAKAGGGFEAPDTYPGGSATEIIASRFNGDRRLDLMVTNFYTDVVQVYRGRANGTFKQPLDSPAGSGPGPAALGDFNRDGKKDLAVLDEDVNTAGVNPVAILRGRGDGTFRAPLNFGVADFGEGFGRIAIADFNRDGHPDVAMPLEREGKVALLRRKPGSRLGSPHFLTVGDTPTAVLGARLNRDRLPDIATTVSTGSTTNGHVSVLLKK